MPEQKLILRSYRLAFELERRIHRIDRFRIPVPYGLPLAGIGYGAAILIGVLALSSAPLMGPLLALLPLPMRLVLVPCLGAHLLCRIGSDGRPAHEAFAARFVLALSPRHLLGLEPVAKHGQLFMARVVVVSDERTPDYSPGTVRGPARVLLRQPARVQARAGTAEITQSGD